VCVCIYIYIFIYSSRYRDAGPEKDIKRVGTAMHVACQEKLLCHFGQACHRFASTSLDLN